MRRIASHYVYWHRLYKMHYIELDDAGRFQGIYPLKEEIAGTEFYDGTLIPFSVNSVLTFSDCLDPLGEWKKKADAISIGDRIEIYCLRGIRLSPAEFCTNNGSCNGYIERL